VLSASYEDTAIRYELRGLTPTGHFAETERENHLVVLKGWAEQLRDLTGGGPSEPRVMRVGPVRHLEKVDEVLDPVVLNIKKPCPARVEIHGTTQPLIDEPQGFLRFVTRRSVARKPHKEFLRVFLDKIILAAANRSVDTFHSAFIVNAHPRAVPDRRVCAFHVVNEVEARLYLTFLVEEMLSRVHDYLLPCDAVFDVGVSRDGRVDEARLAAVLESIPETIDRTASRWGPVAHLEDYAPPHPGDAAEMIRKRFRLYFDMLVTAEAGS
jgi:exodeoxyribonuclease V gamma subunit